MVAEVALTLVLLIGAGLMVRSFVALQQVRPGFDPGYVLSFRVSLPVAKYARPEMRAEFIRRMEEEIRTLPGVTQVGVTSQLPLTGSGSLSPFAYDEATARNWESATADGRGASPDYFRALGTRLLAGRFFDERDRGANVIIIDETLAARAWPGENAVGKRLQTAADRIPECLLRGGRRRRAHPQPGSGARRASADLQAAHRLWRHPAVRRRPHHRRSGVADARPSAR